MSIFRESLMKQILKPVGYMALVLVGGIAQIISVFIIKSLGIDYFDNASITFLSFLGVFGVSVLIFEIVLVVNWRSSKTQYSSGKTVPLTVYRKAIESRNSAIQHLRSLLSNTEQELQKSKIRIGELERQRDNFKQASDKANAQLQQEQQKSRARIAELERERDNFKQASDKANAQLQQEQQKFKLHIAELEKEQDRFKQNLEKISSELEQERQNIEKFKNQIQDLEQFRDSILEIVARDVANNDIVLVTAKVLKDMGDNNETQKWRMLFSKLKNPQIRSSQERQNGDGWVYPKERSSDGRRIMYLREERKIQVIKICEIFRTHDGNKKYDEIRTEGLNAQKYHGLPLVYLPLENAT